MNRIIVFRSCKPKEHSWTATKWDHGIAWLECIKCGRVGDFVAVKIRRRKK